MPNPHGTDDWATLSPRDADALEAILEARAALAAGTPGTPGSPGSPEIHGRDARATSDRAAAARHTLSLLDHLPDELPSAGLTERTMARITAARGGLRLVGGGESRGPSFGLTLPELLSLAAMVVFGISLALPLLARSRADAQRFACQTNLANVAGALTLYATDHNDLLPRDQIEPGIAWWHVGTRPRRNHAVQSNSAHLYLLARHGYLSPGTLACPAYEHAPRGMTTAMHDWPRFEAVSYSYQNQYTPDAPRLSNLGDMVVLADKNPLFLVEPMRGLSQRDDLPDTTPSTLHGSRGQNMLSATGAVVWSASPMMRDDNIWLAAGVNHYNGTEVPSSALDSFLVP